MPPKMWVLIDGKWKEITQDIVGDIEIELPTQGVMNHSWKEFSVTIITEDYDNYPNLVRAVHDAERKRFMAGVVEGFVRRRLIPAN